MQSLDLTAKPRQHRRLAGKYPLASPTLLELKDIKILIDLMKKNDLSVFQMEKNGFKILLKKGVPPVVQAPAALLPMAAAAPSVPAAVSAAASPATAPAEAYGEEIVSPMVGTFYQAMSPDSPPCVKVGQSVQPDTVVCVIEAMKVMNEIKAELAGVVAEVLVENGKPVQFGQPLFRLK
jgi:acetyl-CoA carboxylase biotin carboxyl carrier protein